MSTLTTKAIELGASLVYQFDEASGSLVDQVGSNNATASGTPDYQQAGVVGSKFGVGFDGSTDYFTAGSNVLNGASAYTVELLVKLNTTASTNNIFCERDAGTDGVRLDNTGANLRWRHNAVDVTSSTTIPVGDWMHAVAAWDGSTITLYIDGESVGSQSVATAIATTTVARIGEVSFTSGAKIDGDIAHFAIYPTALDADDIRTLYLTGQPPSTYSCTLSSSAVDSSIVNGVARIGTSAFDASINAAIVAASHGSNVWFSTDSAGLSDIASKPIYESGSVIAFDVAVPSMSASSDTTIYLHIGSVPGGYSNDPYPASAEIVMDDSDFTNLTSNTNDGTGGGGVSAGGVTGPDGNLPATDFDGTDDRVDVTLSSLSEPFTIGGWIRTPVASADNTLASVADKDVNADFHAVGEIASKLTARTYDGTISDAVSGTDVGSTWTHCVGVYATDSSREIYVDGVPAATNTDTRSVANIDRLTIGTTADSTPFGFTDGEIAGVSLYSAVRSAAEIKLDYLLQGPNASTYWTVTSVSPLPDPTFELRSDQDVVLSGSDVTSWGNASGGTSPSFSNDPADKVLGFPAVQFDVSGTEHLRWDETASMFSGDDPDYTIAALVRTAESGVRLFYSAGNDDANAYDGSGLLGIDAATSTRNDGTASSAVATASSTVDDLTPYLIIVKQEGGTRSILAHRVSDGAEVSAEFAIDRAETTMLYAALGCRLRGQVADAGWGGDIFRIRLYNQALDGDLTGDLTGTQLEVLKNEMLQQAGGTLLQRHHYFLGLGAGIGLS